MSTSHRDDGAQRQVPPNCFRLLVTATVMLGLVAVLGYLLLIDSPH